MAQRSSSEFGEAFVGAFSLASAPREDTVSDSVIVVDARSSALSPSVLTALEPSAGCDWAVSPMEPVNVSTVGFGAHSPSTVIVDALPSLAARPHGTFDDGTCPEPRVLAVGPTSFSTPSWVWPKSDTIPPGTPNALVSVTT